MTNLVLLKFLESQNFLIPIDNKGEVFEYSLKKWEKKDFLVLINWTWKYKFDFYSWESDSSARVVILNFCCNKNIEIEFGSILDSVNTQSHVEIVNFVNNWTVAINSCIQVNSSATDSYATLNQQNIFLWDNATIKWVPRLNVKTNNTKAVHSLKAERIKEGDLFYIKSRWINWEKAVNMILKSKIYKQLDFIESKDKNIEKELEKLLENEMFW